MNTKGEVLGTIAISLFIVVSSGYCSPPLFNPVLQHYKLPVLRFAEGALLGWVLVSFPLKYALRIVALIVTFTLLFQRLIIGG